jgi:DNA polymerase I-like protein with 3'-5' exonuclease and polymerase domains
LSYAIWDIETGIKTRFKRKGSPFGAGNHVVTHGFKHSGGAVTEHRFGKTAPGPGWLAPVLANAKLIVGFNIKFDLLHALQDSENLALWMQWVTDGGNVWDCQLAEYLLEGMTQENHMLSLDEVSPRYGGNVKVDEVKALWAAGVDTQDIEPELLTRYLCGGHDEHGQWQLGDIENTEKVFLGQLKRARDVGQVKSILLNCGALIFTTECERNGMFVDVELGKQLAAELKARVDEVHALLLQYLPPDLPFPFNWNSRFHKSALIFGGKVKYQRREYQLIDGSFTFDDNHPEQVYVQKDETHVVLIDGQTWPAVASHDYPADIEERLVRYAGGKNAGEVKTKKVKVDDLSKPKSRMGADCFTFPGFTKPKAAWQSAEPGVYSTASDVIEELGNSGVPFLQAFSELQKLTKDLGTYFIVTDPETGESKGMLSLVDEHGIIHHRINQTSTVTARFSSSDPNLQNIPKGNKSKVKLVFISRFVDGKIIQSDFTALEIYIQAILTGCKQLIADLKAGLDMHVLRLSNSPAGEGKSYDELMILCKGNKLTGEGPIKEWDYKRTDSKVYSFQAAYGAGDTKIAESTGMQIELVAQLREADDKRYPEINRYFAARTDEIKLNRQSTGIVIPHPDVPGLTCHLGKSKVRTPDGKVYSYRESPSPEYLAKRGINSSFSPTEIKNYEVQGEGGEWAKAAAWLAVREFYRNQCWGQRGLLVNQVHDAVYADAAPEVAFEVAATLHACMEGASDFMEWYFNWPIPVPVPSDTSWGKSMMDEESIPGVKDRAATLRQELRSRYMGGYVPSFIKEN